MANIYDIAAHANVSRSTVSRVLNNHPSVSLDKRERVLAAIEALKYTPSATARALAMNRTNAIGVVARDLAHPFYGQFINAIHAHADYKGYGVLYAMKNPFQQTSMDYKALMHKKVDGYLFLGEGTASIEDLESLIHNKIPFVGLEFDHPTKGGIYLTINNQEITYQVTEHLLELKHDKIIYITYDGLMQEFAERIEGYKSAMADADHKAISVHSVSFDREMMYQDMTSILRYIKERDITAAICANNTIAGILLEHLIEAGVRVPEDFSVVGFDDTLVERPYYINRQSIPEISSVKQPHEAMAAYAVEALSRALDGEDAKEERRCYKCELIIRDTTKIRKQQLDKNA